MSDLFLNGEEYAFLDNDPHIASPSELRRRGIERLKFLTEYAIEHTDKDYDNGKCPPLGRKYIQFYGSDGLKHWDLVYDKEMSDRLYPQDGTLNGLIKNVYSGVISDIIPDGLELIKKINYNKKTK